jgi:uncharacterized paraquat-inducible protein A
MKETGGFCSDCQYPYARGESPPCPRCGSRDKTIAVSDAATVTATANLVRVKIARLLNTSEVTLLGVVFGIAITVGVGVGAAVGAWFGALVGFASALLTFGVEVLILRSPPWHSRLVRLAARLRPPA